MHSMPKKAKDLSALEVSRLTTPGHHAVGGVAGLYLYVLDTGARSWVLRTMVGTKRRHMGLGGYPDVPLAQAREKARAAKTEVSQGVDPIGKRNEQAILLKAQQATHITFEEAASEYIETHEKSWKNPKHRAQWSSTLKTYAYPHIGSLLVKEIDQEHLLKILKPIWTTKTETASRLRGRIESVLDWAATRKLRSVENPARWRGNLKTLLPAPSKVQKVTNHKAVPYKGMAHFMADLRTREGMAARALEFAILCASRSGEVRGAVWSEIDLAAALWTIPPERMKAGIEHRVPLSTSAIKLLKALPRSETSNLVFVGPGDRPLSDMALTALMRRMKVDAVPHGFRSTFRDWVGDCTDHRRDVAEFALAHKLADDVEAAYRRGDALDKRRRMMEDWASFCDSAPTHEVR
jgi:integrase